jgi:chromosome segregation ATPase
MPTETLSDEPLIDDRAEAGNDDGADEFLELEAKISQVAAALAQTRGERDRAVAALGQLQSAMENLQRAQQQSERELVSLRKQRNEVKQRVGRLLRTVQKLDAPDA